MNRNKYVTIVLCLLFGGLGIHRIYLKSYEIGLAYILLFVFFPYVGSSIAFFECIYFACLSKKEFDKKYN